jgi:hypothetical protein
MGIGSERNHPCSCGSGKKFKRCHGYEMSSDGEFGTDPAGTTAMRSMRSWSTLHQLVGVRMPVPEILEMVGRLDRNEALLMLARIAGDLANGPDGITGPEARAWTHDLLAQRIGSSNPLENAVARAVAALNGETAIVHGHVLFALQAIVLAHGAGQNGDRPHAGQLAFLMLALNDHLPEWPEPSPGLTQTEELLGMTLYSSIFNHTFDDPLRFALRTQQIMGGDVTGSPISQTEWTKIQLEAFSCSFSEYVESFLYPMFALSRTWGAKRPPAIVPTIWTHGSPTSPYARWFEAASATVDNPAWVDPVRLPSGLPRLPGAFFRTPFVRFEEGLLALSPWHITDHIKLGTWAKLNEAAKKVLATASVQAFTSTFGYLFERWCASVAREAATRPGFHGRLLVPSSPGAIDEIEDVVIVDGNRVALFSAKASLIPEVRLKSARNLGSVVEWLRRFFLEDGKSAKRNGFRAGALHLLDAKIQKIRAGAYEAQGIRSDSLVIPAVVSYDQLGESGLLYKWLESECTRLGILTARSGVRPLTVLSPDTYEAVLALGSVKNGVADLLLRKTTVAERWGRTDWFLAAQNPDAKAFRLPTMEQRFQSVADRSVERLRGILGVAA